MAKDEVLQVRFNLENQQDLMKWEHIKSKANRQAYIKDLILIDMVFDVFKHPESLSKTRINKLNVEDKNTLDL